MAELIPWLSPLPALWAMTAAAAIGIGRTGAVRARRAADLAPPAATDGELPAAGESFELGRTAIAAEAVDTAAALHDAVRGLARDAGRLRAQVRVALGDDLMVHVDRRALHRALTDIIRTALRLSPGAAILLTARRHGGRIEIACLADGPAESEAGLRVALRDAAAIFALHGASMEIDPRPDGAVVRVRLPEFLERPCQPAAGQPAGEAAAPRRIRSDENAPRVLT